METAVEYGYRHIDTAFSYAKEKDIGKALQKLFSSEKVTREELFIVTKVTPFLALSNRNKSAMSILVFVAKRWFSQAS